MFEKLAHPTSARALQPSEAEQFEFARPPCYGLPFCSEHSIGLALPDMEKYILDRSKLEPSDIILTSDTTTISKGIRLMTFGKYSHAAIYVGGTSIEATLKGVFSKNLQRMIFDSADQVAVFRSRRPLTDDENRKICGYARAQVGSLYSIPEALTIRTRSALKLEETRGQFCSRLVAKSFESAGYDLMNLRDPAYCTPKQLGLCKAFRQVDDIVIQASEGEVSFAKSPDPVVIHHQHTYEWLNKVRELVVGESSITGIEIQTINDVSDFLLKFPQYGNKVSEFIDNTKYLHFYSYDIEASPWRYNKLLFRLVMMDQPDPMAFIENELDKEADIFYPASVNLEGHIHFAKQQKLRYFTSHIQLYTNIIKEVYARLEVIIATYESIGGDEIAEEVLSLKELLGIARYAIGVGEAALK